MENLLASESDIIHKKSLSVNNMLKLQLMLYNLDTDNVPLTIIIIIIIIYLSCSWATC
jgi:hypothetical protein